MTTLRHPRHLAAATLVLSLTLAGCSATNRITTLEDYDASDGVGLRLGDVALGNLMVLTAAEGAPGTLLGSVDNRGPGQVEVTIAVDGQESTVVQVGAGQTVLLGPEAVPVDVTAVPAPPGALVTVLVDSDAGGSTTVQVPVLDGTLPEYTDLVPAFELPAF